MSDLELRSVIFKHWEQNWKTIKVHLVGVEEVRWDKSGNESADKAKIGVALDCQHQQRGFVDEDSNGLMRLPCCTRMFILCSLDMEVVVYCDLIMKDQIAL
jgi:hypothetical protein